MAVRCVLGDPFFTLVAKKDAIAEATRFDSFEGPYILNWNNPQSLERQRIDSLLAPSLFSDAMVIVLVDPPMKIIEAVVSAAYENNSFFPVIGIEDDGYDKKCKVMKKLDDEGCVVNYGFVQHGERQKFKQSIKLMCSLDGLKISDKALDAAMEIMPTEIKNVRNKTGKKYPQSVYRLLRVRSELLKIQSFAGYDQEIEPWHIQSGFSRLGCQVNIWDMVNVIIEGPLNLAIDLIDKSGYDDQQYRQVLGAIVSELKTIILLADAIEKKGCDIDPTLLSGMLVANSYEFFDEEKTKTLALPSWYRINQILKRRKSNIWHCRQHALKICELAYHEGRILKDWNAVIMLLCLRFSNLGEGSTNHKAE